MSTLAEIFQEEVKKLAGGDSDSLVDFYDGLCQLSEQFGIVEIARANLDPTRAEPAVQLFIGVSGSATLRNLSTNDRLTRDETRRYAEHRDGTLVINRLVHDLLNDAWRAINGQEDIVGVEVKLAA